MIEDLGKFEDNEVDTAEKFTNMIVNSIDTIDQNTRALANTLDEMRGVMAGFETYMGLAIELLKERDKEFAEEFGKRLLAIVVKSVPDMKEELIKAGKEGNPEREDSIYDEKPGYTPDDLPEAE